ncbi:MAG: LmbE family protein [Candidatus Berkelbacteria bacterium]|nr:LmbE family protein [Candidatus Berkelbacteria bacterium]
MKKYWLVARRNKIILIAMIIILGSLAGYYIYVRKNQVLPQAAIYFLDDIKLPEKGQKVLVFSPHPDDESIGAAGFIYDSVSKGAQVKIVLVTDGNKRHIKIRRYQEFEKATGILGVKKDDLIYLNYPDGNLKEENQSDLLAKFKDIIDQYRPNIIIYPSVRDTHPDHATTGKIVATVLKNEHFQMFAYAYLIHSRHWPQPKKMALDLYLLPPIKFINFDDQWQKLMLDAPALAKKREAVFSYQSQIKVPLLRRLILSSIRANELFTIEKSP